jgi:hypothetical protein
MVDLQPTSTKGTNMQTITRTELREQLMERRGASMVSIVSETEPKMYAKRKPSQLSSDALAGVTDIPNPYRGKVHKISHVNGVINWRYANAVNNQRAREGQPTDEEGNVEHFEALPRKWGQRLQRDDGTVTPLVEHKGRHYLELKVERSLGHEYRDESGEVVPQDDIAPWLYPHRKSARQQTDKEIILRDYALDNIKQVRMDGELYEVTD